MQCGGTYIEIVAFFLEAKANKEVYGNTYTGGEKHDQRLDRLRMLETLNGFPGDSKGDEDQGDGIDESCEDADAMIAKGFVFIRRSLSLHDGKPGEAEGKEVSDNVPGIRE